VDASSTRCAASARADGAFARVRVPPVGYGPRSASWPLHNWLPTRTPKARRDLGGCSRGLLLNVALYAVVRSKVLVDGALGRNFSGGLMMGFGLLSVVVARSSSPGSATSKRMFAYSSIEHMGIMTFAFGHGGAVAAFAGLLHMTVHSLTKSAIFFTSATPRRWPVRRTWIRSAASSTRARRSAGPRAREPCDPRMPPFGVFTSEFMVLTTAMHEHSWGDAFPAGRPWCRLCVDLRQVQPMVFGETTAQRPAARGPRSCPYCALAIVLALGLYIPPTSSAGTGRRPA